MKQITAGKSTPRKIANLPSLVGAATLRAEKTARNAMPLKRSESTPSMAGSELQGSILGCLPTLYIEYGTYSFEILPQEMIYCVVPRISWSYSAVAGRMCGCSWRAPCRCLLVIARRQNHLALHRALLDELMLPSGLILWHCLGNYRVNLFRRQQIERSSQVLPNPELTSHTAISVVKCDEGVFAFCLASSHTWLPRFVWL